MAGDRDPVNGLWSVPVPASPPLLINNVTTTVTQSVADRIAFYHATMFSPTISTWCRAIDAGHLTTWPELTSKQVRQHLPASRAMLKGHLDQTRSNAQSTKKTYAAAAAANLTDTIPSPPVDEEAVLDSHPTQDPTSLPGAKSHFLYATIHNAQGQIYTDQPGRFLVASSKGNAYMLVLYDYDSNYIHVEPMPSRSKKSILAAYKKAIAILIKAGLRPKLQRLDNEASVLLQDFMSDQQIDFQLVPPHIHRRNAAERAIRTWKNHFIAGLCSTDQNFPLHLWDRLLPQAMISLNLLRGSRINPKLSAYAQVHGAFDFNRTPLAPPGTKVLVHEKPDVRASWAAHAVDGWYVGPALLHYRCYRVWITETTSERVADTLSWYPTQVSMPKASTTEEASAAARDLIQALLHPGPASPLAPLCDSKRQALFQLADIFTEATADCLPSPPTVPLATDPLPTAALPRVPETEKAVSPPRVPPSPRVPVPAQPISPPATPARPPATFASKTRNLGKQRRARAKRSKQAKIDLAAAQSLNRQKQIRRRTRPPPNQVPGTSATLLPTVAPAPPRHRHYTRSFSNKPSLTLNMANSARLCVPEYVSPNFVANAVFDPVTGASLELRDLLQGPDKHDWIQSNANEIGRLAQGVLPHMTSGSDTMFFIKHTDVPKGRKATYLRTVSELRPQKEEEKRVRFTVGGNLVDYPGKVSTPTANLAVVKCLLNSTISTPGARFMTGDIKNFYLGTPMGRYEYMRIPVKFIPISIMEQYNLAPLVHNGHVMVEIRKGMYGLPQAGILANERLVKHLEASGYVQSKRVPGLFKHETRPVTFSLVVDDFGIKYVGKENAEHLLNCLRSQYTITTDWTGSLYCGLTLKWDYTKRIVDMSLPGYVARALHRFQHPKPNRDQHAPHTWIAPSYGAKQQLTIPADTTDSLDPPEITRTQEIVGTLLYYARAVDSTMLVALGSLAAAKNTQAKAQAITQLLNYCATKPEATVRYHASDMSLKIHSDASYLSEPKARSRAGGYFYLSSHPTDPSQPPTPTSVPPPMNGAIHVLSSILDVVLASATEAELGACYFNAREGVAFRIILDEMGHPQPPTPLQVDNSCAAGIVNDTVKQRRSKAIDMRFYWLKDRTVQGQFHIHWRKGSDNLADYFTKHHSPMHHRRMRTRYLLHLHKPDFVSGEGVLIGVSSPPPGSPRRAPRVLNPGNKPRLSTAARSYRNPHNLI
jgi:hypothetical protein